MSLKAFHIVFVGCSVLLSTGVAAWTGRLFLEGGSGEHLALALTSGGFAGALVVYGIAFWKKIERLEASGR